jgi:hypothetical protein
MATQELSFTGPLSLVIAEGATTPDPGFSGARAYSTTTQRVMEWRGGAWISTARISVGATAPSNPSVGDLWVDTN